jgi:small conductance mechanosensitive channel
LGTFGIETASFAALLAGAGLAVGLAMQGTLANVSAGVLLLVFRPFKVGDSIIVAGQAGTVYALGIFMTTLDTSDNRRIILPNGSVLGSTIENISHHDTRRVSVAVGADYSANVDKTRKALLAAITKVEAALDDPAPAVVLTGLGASSVDWQVRVWCKSDDYWAVLEETTVQVKKALDKAKIGIPYNTLDVNIVSGASS